MNSFLHHNTTECSNSTTKQTTYYWNGIGPSFPCPNSTINYTYENCEYGCLSGVCNSPPAPPPLPISGMLVGMIKPAISIVLVLLVIGITLTQFYFRKETSLVGIMSTILVAIALVIIALGLLA
jgi:hypothetical protein